MYRHVLIFSLAVAAVVILRSSPTIQAADRKDPKIKSSVRRGLDYLAREQRRQGYLEANGGQYRVAMTALAGVAWLSEGSTPTQGRYAKNIRLAVDYLTDMSQPNGLIGFKNDYHYTYGHGFSMLFLSQVFGEEEHIERREELKLVLTKAVQFCVNAQTSKGGWGYVSAKDGNDFDEGSTCITQVQGLRACRNAGIPVPKEIIEKAKKYIFKCKNADGGISYSSRNRGSSRPAITAAALATLYNAGAYDGDEVAAMSKYCKDKLYRITDNTHSFGHWHYTYLYYSQVVYREGVKDRKHWETFRDKLYNRIVGQQSGDDGSWSGNIGPIYVTACNLIMLQFDKGYLPIFQR
jgi:hypothetical protein